MQNNMNTTKQKVDSLSTKEWLIYNFLKERSANDLWTKQKEIQQYLKTFGIGTNLRTIRYMINHIRSFNIIQKVIITDYGKGYKILNDMEQIDYLEKRKISILKMFKQYWKDIERLSLNNYQRLNLSKEEKEFIESVLEKK